MQTATLPPRSAVSVHSDYSHCTTHSAATFYCACFPVCCTVLVMTVSCGFPLVYLRLGFHCSECNSSLLLFSKTRLIFSRERCIECRTRPTPVYVLCLTSETLSNKLLVSYYPSSSHLVCLPLWSTLSYSRLTLQQLRYMPNTFSTTWCGLVN